MWVWVWVRVSQRAGDTVGWPCSPLVFPPIHPTLTPTPPIQVTFLYDNGYVYSMPHHRMSVGLGLDVRPMQEHLVADVVASAQGGAGVTKALADASVVPRTFDGWWELGAPRTTNAD